jgi:DNA polymerase-1
MRLLLVDGHYYAYRSFYAIQHLRNSRGEPTNAVYGFVKALRRMLLDVQPDHTAAILDGGLSPERMTLQPDYKANRAAMPEDLEFQLPLIAEIIPPLGLAHICVDGLEADDLIACYAKAAEKIGAEVIIATNDKDLMQLVSERVKIYSPQKDGFLLLGEKEVEEKWGVPPRLVGDVLCLTGDSVDNIPGVPGVGPKTAAAWIRQFGSLDGLLARSQEIKSEKQRAALNAARAQMASNRGMIQLHDHLPLPQPLDSLVRRPDYPELIRQMERLEFKGLLNEIRKEWETQKPKAQTQDELF